MSGSEPRPEGLDETWFPHESGGFLGILGPIWERREDGAVSLALRATPRHENLSGVVQGGLLMTLADRALGQTARLATGFAPQATVQLDAHFLAPAPIGSLLIARGVLLRRGGRLMFLSGEVRADGRMALAATGVWSRLSAPPAPQGDA